MIVARGVLAQLVERNNGIVEASGSNPLHSIVSSSRPLMNGIFCTKPFSNPYQHQKNLERV
jgi:hypothetical protein